MTGLAAAGAIVVGGQSATAYLVDSCIPSACFGGLITIDNSFFDPSDLSASGAYVSGDDSARVILALGANPADPLTDNTGALDPGLDGPLDMPSARDATVILSATTVGTHVLSFFAEYSDSVDVLPFQSTQSFTLTVIPEPSTALLLLGGLALFARSRRSCAQSMTI